MNVRSVEPSTLAFWTITSTLTSASANGSKRPARDAGPVDDAKNGDLGNVRVRRDGSNSIAELSDRAAHVCSSMDKCPWTVYEAGGDENRDVVYHTELYRAWVHLGAVARQLEHLLEPDLVELARTRHQSRVRRIYTIDVTVYFAPGRAETGGDRDRSQVRCTPPQRRDLHVVGGPLEPCDGDDLARAQLVQDAARLYERDPRPAVGFVGPNTSLGTAEADGAPVQGPQRHRHQSAGDQLSCREQYIQLSRVGSVCDLTRESRQFIGGLAHRGDRCHDATSAVLGPRDTVCYPLDG